MLKEKAKLDELPRQALDRLQKDKTLSQRNDRVLFAQLTTDGELDYSYGMEGGRGETNKTMEESLKKRKSTGAMWSPDSSRFALVRHDQREVEDLWVVHAVGNERPELESYKYLLRTTFV